MELSRQTKLLYKLFSTIALLVKRYKIACERLTWLCKIMQKIDELYFLISRSDLLKTNHIILRHRVWGLLAWTWILPDCLFHFKRFYVRICIQLICMQSIFAGGCRWFTPYGLLLWARWIACIIGIKYFIHRHVVVGCTILQYWLMPQTLKTVYILSRVDNVGDLNGFNTIYLHVCWMSKGN